jgi:2,4-dienoyl-CoA reductase (NADPH2)
MAFAYPQFPIDLYRTGEIDAKKACITCSKCTELMRMDSVTGCVVRNSNYMRIYREVYREYKKKERI